MSELVVSNFPFKGDSVMGRLLLCAVALLGFGAFSTVQSQDCVDGSCQMMVPVSQPTKAPELPVVRAAANTTRAAVSILLPPYNVGSRRAVAGYGSSGSASGYGSSGSTVAGYGSSGLTASGYGSSGTTVAGYGSSGSAVAGYGSSGSASGRVGLLKRLFGNR